MTLLTVSGIRKQTEGDFVLQNINFTQQKFQKMAISGETGSGKSTLLKIIAGLIQPENGEVIFENKKVVGPDDQLVPGHPEISYLSQHFELPKSLRVEQVLEYANILSTKSASTLYEVCEIDHLLKRRTDQLSGGEKQRIALAKLLITSPKLLLLDEPFSHLDMAHKNTLKNVISNICKKLKITCILVSHDPLDILSWADEIIVMKAGIVVQQGSPELIYRQPVNAYVASLFGKFNLIHYPESKPLLKVSKIQITKKSLLIRPENFRLGSSDRRGVKGKIIEIIFCGTHYEIVVELLKISIVIKTEIKKVSVGDIVFISTTARKVWYI